jgi:hypothetical protein
MGASMLLRGQDPGSFVRLANSRKISPGASVAYVSGPVAGGNAPPEVTMLGYPAAVPPTGLLKTLTLTVATAGAVGTATMNVLFNGDHAGTFTTAASVVDSAVLGVTFCFTAGSYQVGQSWTWNVGNSSAASMGDVVVADLQVIDVTATYAALGTVILYDASLVRFYQFTQAGVLFPPNPWDGMPVIVQDASNAAFTYNILVAANTGQTIENPYQQGAFSAAGGSWPLFVNGETIEYRWNQTLGAWCKVSSTADALWPIVSVITAPTVTLTGRCLVEANSSSAAVTLKMPASPSQRGLVIGVKDVGGVAAANNITVNGNGGQLDYDDGWPTSRPSLVSSAVIATNFRYAEWIWTGNFWALKGIV